MSSLQAQPQQQPVQVYPSTITNQPNPHFHHSKGSFGTVFIVLAIILVISTIACFLGRLCNGRYNNDHNHNHNHNQRRVPGAKPQRLPQQIHNVHYPREAGDVENGFDDKRIPTSSSSRPNGHHHHHADGDDGGHLQGESIEPRSLHADGNMKGFEMKHGHEGEHRAGA